MLGGMAGEEYLRVFLGELFVVVGTSSRRVVSAEVASRESAACHVGSSVVLLASVA